VVCTSRGLSGVRARVQLTSGKFLHSHAEIRAGYRQSSLTLTFVYHP
jgi:hypothetical protein